jgi:2-oxo-3-hexenedioate decarboxylase
MTRPDIEALAERLIGAYDNATMLAPLSASVPGFDVVAAYQVLAEIERRRIAQGWQPAARKIGFTNRTIWARYGVYQPMWAHAWAHTVQFAPSNHAVQSLARLVQPRIEPEVVFKLRAPVPITGDAEAILQCVEWMAPGFEIVQSHFPEWKFTAADCTAAFGLHGALIVGAPLAVTPANRAAIAASLATFTLELSRAGIRVDTGTGANVLGSPALALAHLAGVLATQSWAPPLAAGEVITTGTLTDAWPVAPDETWHSDYGELGLPGLTVKLT